MREPTTVEEWLSIVDRNEKIATLLSADRKLAQDGYFHSGQAVEAALKAYIIWRKRPNDWIAYRDRNGLKTHDIRKLMLHAGIVPNAAMPLAASWLTVIQWDNSQRYDPRRMPRKVAKGMCEACFGPDGVVTWIRSILTT